MNLATKVLLLHEKFEQSKFEKEAKKYSGREKEAYEIGKADWKEDQKNKRKEFRAPAQSKGLYDLQVKHKDDKGSHGELMGAWGVGYHSENPEHFYIPGKGLSSRPNSPAMQKALAKLKNKKNEGKEEVRELSSEIRTAVNKGDEKELKALLKKVDDYAHEGKIKFKQASGFSDQIWRRLDTLLGEEFVEGKKDYEVYHKSYTSAVQEAEDFAKKNGFDVDKEKMATDIGMNTKRPKAGETTRFTIDLFKGDKEQKKKLHAQVYGMDHSKNDMTYELNMYIS